MLMQLKFFEWKDALKNIGFKGEVGFTGESIKINNKTFKIPDDDISIKSRMRYEKKYSKIQYNKNYYYI
jgi:hypothetical protein